MLDDEDIIVDKKRPINAQQERRQDVINVPAQPAEHAANLSGDVSERLAEKFLNILGNTMSHINNALMTNLPQLRPAPFSGVQQRQEEQKREQPVLVAGLEVIPEVDKMSTLLSEEEKKIKEERDVIKNQRPFSNNLISQMANIPPPSSEVGNLFFLENQPKPIANLSEYFKEVASENNADDAHSINSGLPGDSDMFRPNQRLYGGFGVENPDGGARSEGQISIRGDELLLGDLTDLSRTHGALVSPSLGYSDDIRSLDESPSKS